MNIKRLLAFTLVGTLSLSNISWAGISGPEREMVSRERRMSAGTPSNADTEATASNAFFDLARVSEGDEITWEVDREEIFCGSSYEVRVSNDGQTSQEAALKIQCPDGGKKLLALTIPAGGTEIITVPGGTFSVPGMYRLGIVDKRGEEREYTRFFTVMVKKRSSLTVTFTEYALNRVYNGKSDTLIGEVPSSAFTATADGEALEGLYLTNISCVLEEGDQAGEPGVHPVVKLSSDQCDDIKVTANEFAFLVIQKIPSDLSFKPLNLPIDGRELVVDIAQISNIPAGQDITSVKVGEIKDTYSFASLPVAEGTTIRFSLAKSSAEKEISIPLIVEGTYYTYGQRTLKIKGTLQSYVETRTENEIREYFEQHPFDMRKRETWDIMPDPAGEIAGKLSEESVENGLNALNFIRYAAGMGEVSINSDYETYAQAGTVLLRRVGKLEHRPAKPEGMSERFFQLGYQGTSGSNLGLNYTNLADSVITGWMNDGDWSNIADVGHRRWALDPGLRETGFGSSGPYTAMYVWGSKNDTGAEYDYVPWPAQTMPAEYLMGPWSVLLKKNVYTPRTADDIRVTLDSDRTGRIVLGGSGTNTGQVYFNYSTGSYGAGPAIIFDPGVKFQAGDKVDVTITGLTNKSGEAVIIRYTVNFFSMDIELPELIPLEEIRLSEESVVVDTGTYKTLTVSIIPEDATDADLEDVVWTSSNPEVAGVHGGVVSGIKDGTAVIAAELNGKRAECAVTVRTLVPLQEIRLGGKSLTLNTGKTYQLTFQMIPDNANDVSPDEVQWFSDNTEVASVDERGLVTANKAGRTDITVRLGQKKADCVVTVVDAARGNVSVLADGREKAVTLEDAGVLQAGESVTVRLKEVPGSGAGYFSSMPVVDGTTVRFALKPSETAFETEILLALVGEGYAEYNNELVLKIQALPQVLPAARTNDQIRGYFDSHSFQTSGADSWSAMPNGAREEAGRLTRESVANGLNALNFVRYVAGIPYNVTNNETYERAVQAGTTLLTQSDMGLTHTPDKPSDMSDEFYQLGFEGTSSSNLGQGYGNLAQAVIYGWMDDGDSRNIDRVGHRRWCLNPGMKQTGFGHSGVFTGMYAFDSSGSQETEHYNYVPWPGQNMPIEYFEGPWSVSLNPGIYSVEKTDNLTVTMTSEKTTRSYVLDERNADPAGAYLKLASRGYGFGPAVIFQPGVEFGSGDTVAVRISGLKDRYGNELPIEYSVSFFSMAAKALESIRLNSSSKTMTVGSTYQLTVTMVPSDADASLDDVIWTSSDEDVAYVDSDGEVTAIDPGTAKITAELDEKTAVCVITVRKSGSGGGSGGGGSTGGGGGSGGGGSTGGGGSSGGGGSTGGGGSSGGSGSSGGGGASSGGSGGSGGPGGSSTASTGSVSSQPWNPSLPDYVVVGTWTEANGQWQFTDSSGQRYRDNWAAVYNPYANTALGQSPFDWFRFDQEGNMMVGWFLDYDGSYYYLNPVSDGTRGKMMTGWVWIPDPAGVNKCYYLNPVSDGYRGRMYSNTVVEGYTVNGDGQWTVNGVIQTR